MTDIMKLVRDKKQAIEAQSGRREKTVKPQVGKNRFRILPGWRGEEDPLFFHDFGQHFVKGVDGVLKAVYICTEKTFGKPCAVCQAIGEGIKASSDDTVIGALEESQAKGRILMNALHLDGDDPSTPVILDLTPTTAEKVFDLMDEYGNITDLTEGVDIVITRTGKGLNTKYSVMSAAKSKKVPDGVMKDVHNLDDYVKQEYDAGMAKVLGAVSTVSGLLPPATSADVPVTSADDGMGSVLDSDDSAPIEVEASSVVEEEDVSSDDAASGDDLSDEELDDMLAELGGS